MVSFRFPTRYDRPHMLSVFLFLLAPALQEDSLREAFDALQEGDLVRSRSARTTIRNAGEASIPFALRALKEGDSDLEKRVDSLVQRLSLPGWEDRNRATEELIRIGYPVLAFLESRSDAEDPEVAWRLGSVRARLQETIRRGKAEEEERKIFLLGLLGESSSRSVVPLLLEYLEASSFSLRLIAAGSLSRLVARLDSVEVGTISGRVIDFLRLRKGTLDRARLVRILGRLRSRGAVKPLAGLLLDRTEPDVHLLKTVVVALAAIGGASAFHAIVESLTDPRAYVRHAAAQALREESGKNPRFDARDPDPESISEYRRRWEDKFGRKWTER